MHYWYRYFFIYKPYAAWFYKSRFLKRCISGDRNSGRPPLADQKREREQGARNNHNTAL